MHFSKTIGLAFAATTIAGSAYAADLPSRRVAPAPVMVAPMFTWTGFYVGANVGVGWNAGGAQSGAQNYPGIGSDGAPLGTAGPTAAWTNGVSSPLGILGGLTAGYNLQLSPWLVVGVETDIQLANIRGNGAAATNVPFLTNGIIAHQGAINVSQKTDWFGTLRGRIGFTPFSLTLMLYATGGLAYGSTKTSFAMADMFPSLPAALTGSSTGSSTKVGWTIGGGGEWAFAQNWSIKAEYLYVDLGKSVLNGVNTFEPVGPAPFPLYATSQSYRHKFHVVRAGLNYRFNFGGAGPIVAKY